MLSLNDLPTDISNVAMEKPSSNDHLNESALPDVVVVNSDPCSGPSKSCSQELSLISFHSKSINRTETNDNAQRASFLHTLEDGRGHVSHFVSCSSGDADPCAERDFLQLSGSRGSKREPFHGCEEIEVRGCKKKPKSEHLGLSLALPDVSLALTSENAARNPPERTHSVKSRTPSSNTRTSSDDFTASRSYSYSHLISHSPSCSLTGYPMEYDCSTGSHRTDNDQSWYLHEETNGSVHSRFKPAGDSMVFSAQTHTNCNSTVFRATGSENISFFPSELPARPTNFTKSNDSRNEGPLPSEVRPDKILRVIATESVPTVAQIFQHELLPETVEAVKDHLKNILEGKRDEFECIRQLVQKRKDLSFDTLSKCHQAQLDILVTIKSGSSSFLSKKIHLPSSELIEIFMQLRCRNVVCKNLLPVDDCDCTICSSKKGFCSSCMCAVCVNFDCAANTCSWVGCDVCLHWCHAMCGIQNNLIKPGPSAKGDTGNMEMQFNCLGCGHASELFGFVKEVFLCCASNWGPETLLKELDCVQNIFQGSMDLKGKQLYSHASETKHTLEKKIVSCTEASNRMLQFFNCGKQNFPVHIYSMFVSMDMLPVMLVLILLSLIPIAHSWSWFSSSSAPNSDGSSFSAMSSAGEFSIEIPDNARGMKLVEEARAKLMTTNSCWQNAYRSLFAGCSEIVADKEKQSRLAWYLSDCFQKDSGRSGFPSCNQDVPMMKCLRSLNELEHKVYLEFFLETNTICYQLQRETFKRETERLVNDLRSSSYFLEDKLSDIELKSELLLKSSSHIQDSLASIDLRTEQLALTTKDVQEQIDEVLDHSKAIFDNSKGIVVAQSELQAGQAQMKTAMQAGMELLHKSHESLEEGVENLKKGTLKIEKHINAVGDLMTQKMQALHSRADDIGNVALTSLEKQKQLLHGQSMALEGLDFLTKFQSQALEESRATLQNLAEFGQEKQKELIRQQEQLQQAHDYLILNSRSILAAQEAFESKQANMLKILEQVFTVLNGILLESRFIKTFFYYLGIILLVYWITGAKQISSVRAHFYLGICFTFLIEIAIVRFASNDLHQQGWIESHIFLARSTVLLTLALVLILYSISTYRDYELLNNQMLLSMSDKVETLQRNLGTVLHLLDMVLEEDTNLSSWVDTELPEDDCPEDPDYALPEEVGENSVTTTITKKYSLRPRCR